MLSDEFDADFGGSPAAAGQSSAASCVTIRIARTEEQISALMQRFTVYIIEVSDFGRNSEVPHRYSDFEALHKALLMDCHALRLPPLPPKGVDGSDAAVVASRKVELEKILRAMLHSPEVLLEKQLHLWKFLNLQNPAVIAGRFVLAAGSRAATSKTLAKLTEPRYKDDVYRLGHSSVVDLLLEGARELRNGGEVESGHGVHWARQTGGRTALCQLLAGALSASDSARARLLEADLVAHLLGLVECDPDALDDARLALNVVVSREADRLPAVVSDFLRRGGLSQLAVLAQQPKCQEFVAKLLWLSWDAPVRAPFSQPRGSGLSLLQSLMKSQTPACALLGAVLLAGMVANGDFDAEPAHRAEALRKVSMSLSGAEASMDPQFAKTLCGANSTITRLAGMLDDRELAPVILGLVCAAKPPPARLGRIAGNLAAIVGDKTGSHNEETRARAAELLLHVQSSGAPPGVGVAPPLVSSGATAPAQNRMMASGSGGGDYGAGARYAAAPTAADADLERCEGIAAHEESLDNALRTQLEEAVAKTRQSLEVRAEAVRQVSDLARRRLLQLPVVDSDFQDFRRAFSSFQTARQSWERAVQEGETLHRDMERQLGDLRAARPSSVDPNVYRERLLAAERIHADVKSQREALALADARAREAQQRADRSSGEYRRTTEEVRRLEDDLSGLRVQRSEKETSATKLRHKANTPSLDAMKQQAAESIERNLAQARELQVIGQRVQQGDPDYLRDGETRDMKIAELTQKLAQLKKQHQQLLQQQKELDFDPVALNDQASRLEAEASDLGRRAGELELRRLEAERIRNESVASSSRDSQEARSAQDHRDSLARQLAGTESEARRQLNLLQPMIQEQHSGWQNLLARQKKLDADQSRLKGRLEEAERSAEMEAQMRHALAEQVESLIDRLHGVRGFLQQVEAAAPPAASGDSAAAARVTQAHDPFANDSDPFGLPLAAHTPAPAAPAVAAPARDPFADDSDPFAAAPAAQLRPPARDPFADAADPFAAAPIPSVGTTISTPLAEEPLPLAAAPPEQPAGAACGAEGSDVGASASAPLPAAPLAAATSPIAAAVPTTAAAAGAADAADDDFDAFLREEPPALGGPMTTSAPADAPDEL